MHIIRPDATINWLMPVSDLAFITYVLYSAIRAIPPVWRSLNPRWCKFRVVPRAMSGL